MATQGEAIVDFPGAKAALQSQANQSADQAGSGDAEAKAPELETPASESAKTLPEVPEAGKDLKARAKDFLSLPIDKDITIDWQTQKSLYFALSGINEQFSKLGYTGDSQRALFEQVKHLTEICGQRLDATKTIFENGKQVNLALRAIEVYEGLLLRGWGHQATNAGTKEALVELPAVTLTDTTQGRGFGLLYPHWLGGSLFLRAGEKVSGAMARFLVKEGDRTVEIPLIFTPTETKIITSLFKEAGAQSWSEERFKKELRDMEGIKTAVSETIGLHPFEDLADCNLAAIPHPEAGPASEAGGIDAFENHRRIKFEELVGQTSTEAKNLQEKWEALTPEQQLELWLRSYDLAAEDVFEDFAKQMEQNKEKKEDEKGTHKSRGERLKEKGKRLKQGGGVVTPDMVDQANLRQKQTQETFESLKKAQEDLIKINNDLGEANETVTKNKEYLVLLERQRDEWVKNNTTTGVLKGSQIPMVPLEMQQRIDTITAELASATAKKTRFELQKTQILQGFFQSKTNPLERQAIIHTAEEELERLKAEAQKLSAAKDAGHLEASQADKDQGDRLDRLGQIVSERNAIIGKVDQQWLKELDTLIKQGKLDKAHGLVLELIFESTGTAGEQLTIDVVTQTQFLSQAKIVKAAMETLSLDTRQLTDDEKTDLAKAFVKIAPFLSRNTVQSQRVVGVLINQLYDDAYHDRLTAAVSGVALSPTEKPGMEIKAEKAIAPIEGEVTFEAPSPIKKDHFGKVKVVASLLHAPGMKAGIESVVKEEGLFRAKKFVEAHVGILADDNAYDYFARTYGNDRQAAYNEEWDEKILDYYYDAAGNLRPRQQVATNQFLETSLTFGGQNKKRDFQDVEAALTSLDSFRELEILYPALVAQALIGETDAVKMEANQKMFAKFGTARYSDATLGINYAISFKEGKLWLTGADQITGRVVIPGEDLAQFRQSYKERYMKKNGIVEETKLTPVQLNEIEQKIAQLFAAIGKEALNSLMK